MELRLIRTDILEDRTFGKLYCGDDFICDTLEPPYMGTKDTDDAEYIKSTKKGNTAIPIGRYEIDMNTVSTKFKGRVWGKQYGGIVPWIKNVNGFERVLIHVGNYASRYGISDTNGCVWVGKAYKEQYMVAASTVNYCKLMDNYLIPAKKRGEKIELVILLRS